MSLTIPLAALVLAVTTTPDPMDDETYRRTGGYVLERGAYSGKIVLANAVGDSAAKSTAAAAAQLRELFNVNIEPVATKETDPQRLLSAFGITAVLVIVDDATQPKVLIAPEDRWAKLNLAKMVEDLPSPKAKEKFFASRVHKEILKTFSLLLGGCASQYEGNIMNAATARQLDMCKETIPMDVISRVQRYLSLINVTQPSYTTYRKACREGWAPQPTNEYQKAIWEKVHTPPTNPIKITYDKDKQKPVVK